MQRTISRRHLMWGALSAGALVPAAALIGKESAAAELTPIDPNDAAAKALGFIADASKVDASANGTFKAGQHCGACAQFQGKAGDPRGGCIIFAGRSVPADGWCQAWTQRPS